MDKRERFVELFREDYPGLVRELSLILGDRALAEEVAAEGFVEAWRKWDSIAGLDRPGAWVRRVSLRKASRARWRRARRRDLEQNASHVAPALAALDLDIMRALKALSPAQRTAVVLHHLSGWSTAEIANIVGCAEVTVRSHLSRGRQQLAAELRERNDSAEVRDVKPS
jgi:RNA polymerase sigma-70 factor, ECF subfamily